MLQRLFFKYGLIATMALAVLGAFYAGNLADVKTRFTLKLLLAKADICYRDNEWGDAEVCYRRALLIAPALYSAQYNLANCYYRQQRYTEAAGAYLQALTGGDSTYKAAVYNNLGNTAYFTGKLQQSAEHYRTALLLNPSNVQTRQNYLLVLTTLKTAAVKRASQEGDHKKSGPNSNDDHQKDSKDQASNKSDDKSDDETKASAVNINDLFKLINQSEENLKNRIGSSKQKGTPPPQTGPDY